MVAYQQLNFCYFDNISENNRSSREWRNPNKNLAKMSFHAIACVRALGGSTKTRKDHKMPDITVIASWKGMAYVWHFVGDISKDIRL